MRIGYGLAILLLSSGTALGIHTSHWVQTTEADFQAGTFHNTVATRLGNVELSRQVKTLLRQDPKVSAIYAIAQTPDGTIYAATGPQGVLLQYKGGKVSHAAELPDQANLLSLLVDRAGRLLIGTGGQSGQIFAIDKPGDKPHPIFSPKAVQYIWAMCQAPDGNLYVATGPNGQLFQIAPDGKSKILLTSKENNLLSLAFDGKQTLFVGTDPNGLIYRVNLQTGHSFILYDASESEISALALDDDGNLYAATAEAVGPGVRGLPTTGATEQTGHPEGTGSGAEIPAQPPKMPEPPPLPNPNPGQPTPIPKDPSSSLSFPRHFGQGPGLSSLLLTQLMVDSPAQSSQSMDDPGDAPQPDPNPTSGPGDEATANQPVQLRPEQPEQSPAQAGPQGNAIYRIDPQGFVTEIFRQNVMIMSLIYRDGQLLAGTGPDGLIFQINPKTRQSVSVAKIDPKQVMCLLPAKDGRIYLGAANVGALASMTSGYAPDGTYTSAVLDATQTSHFGLMQMHGTLSKGTTLSVSTRSGNTREPSDSGWSPWSEQIPASQFMRITSPPARYLQYRIHFKTTDSHDTSTVKSVDTAYLLPNLPPDVKTITVSSVTPPAAGTAPHASPRRTISWDASDPNDDPLTYSLQYRPAGAQAWIPLAKDLKDATFTWDTHAVADGRYEVRVTASDAAANPPGQEKTDSRISDVVVVDNTPPVIGDIAWKEQGDGVHLSFKVVDATSTVAAAAYRVDAADHWQAVFPSDNIFDGPAESVSVQIGPLTAGPHQITLRAADAYGNQAFEAVTVTLKKDSSPGEAQKKEP